MKNLVEAQKARRVLDRLVGYKLSSYFGRRYGMDFLQDVYSL
jgi:DNA topoisomerase IA